MDRFLSIALAFCARKFAARVVTASLLLASSGLAKTSSDSAAAQGLFDDGKKLMAAGKFSEACPKFEESERLDPGGGTLANLARCYAETGRIASAWSTYLEAAAAAKAAGNAERESVTRERAAELAPRVSRLVVAVPVGARVAGLVISRDTAVVGTPQWGLAIPEDEGEHTVVAKAPGYEPWQTVAVVKGEGTTTRVTIPRLVKAVRAISPAPASEAQSVPTKVPPASSFGTQRTVAIVAGAVGVVGFGVGAVFGLKAMSDLDDAKKDCNGTACRNAPGMTAGNNAHRAGNLATVGMVVGAVGVASGFTLWLTASKAGRSPQVGFGPSAVEIKGVW